MIISDIAEQFSALTELLSQLRQYLLQQRPSYYYPITGEEKVITEDALQHACTLLSDLWYQGNQDGRETRSRHGIIVADQQAVELIHRINQQKESFRAAINRAKQSLSRDDWQQQHEQLSNHGQTLREQLRLTGLGRVHLKQCYRHIPLLEKPVAKVGFSWYNNGRSIKKISHQQAQDLLLALGEHKTHIQSQLQILSQLTPNTQLAQVQTLAPVVRANLVFSHQDENKKRAAERKAMNVSLPLFVPEGKDHSLPDYNQIELQAPNGRSRLNRSDNKISNDPILPSIRAYTYRIEIQ